MATLAERDAELAAGLDRWWANRRPDSAPGHVTDVARPPSGWSNETLVVTTSRRGRTPPQRERVVVRLPPHTAAIHPTYDLGAQARVLEALGAQGIPVPRVIAFEADEQWMGVPFLVMSYEPGRAGPEVPALDPWIVDAPREAQQRVHDEFMTTLAAIHRVDWRAPRLDAALRGGESALASEIAWWKEYVDWAGEGSPPSTLADAIAWCATTMPAPESPASLCWGDARIGNVLFTEERRVAAVLDWELASIGPAEMDLAWYLALDDLTNRFTGRTVAGFRARAEVIERYEQALAREVVDLAWHEIFALTRSVAINERLARVAAVDPSVSYSGIAGDDNPILGHLGRRIDRFPTGGAGDPR